MPAAGAGDREERAQRDDVRRGEDDRGGRRGPADQDRTGVNGEDGDRGGGGPGRTARRPRPPPRGWPGGRARRRAARAARATEDQPGVGAWAAQTSRTIAPAATPAAWKRPSRSRSAAAPKARVSTRRTTKSGHGGMPSARVRGHGHEEEVGHEAERAAEAEAAALRSADARARPGVAGDHEEREARSPRRGRAAARPCRAASIHQLPRTIQDRKPPATLSPERRVEAASMKRPAFRMARSRARPKSAPGATRVAGEVEEKEERRDQDQLPRPPSARAGDPRRRARTGTPR